MASRSGTPVYTSLGTEGAGSLSYGDLADTPGHREAEFQDHRHRPPDESSSRRNVLHMGLIDSGMSLPSAAPLADIGISSDAGAFLSRAVSYRGSH
jgi:hypothetical protein